MGAIAQVIRGSLLAAGIRRSRVSRAIEASALRLMALIRGRKSLSSEASEWVELAIGREELKIWRIDILRERGMEGIAFIRKKDWESDVDCGEAHSHFSES